MIDFNLLRLTILNEAERRQNISDTYHTHWYNSFKRKLSEILIQIMDVSYQVFSQKPLYDYDNNKR